MADITPEQRKWIDQQVQKKNRNAFSRFGQMPAPMRYPDSLDPNNRKRIIQRNLQNDRARVLRSVNEAVSKGLQSSIPGYDAGYQQVVDGLGIPQSTDVFNTPEQNKAKEYRRELANATAPSVAWNTVRKVPGIWFRDIGGLMDLIRDAGKYGYNNITKPGYHQFEVSGPGVLTRAGNAIDDFVFRNTGGRATYHPAMEGDPAARTILGGTEDVGASVGLGWLSHLLGGAAKVSKIRHLRSKPALRHNTTVQDILADIPGARTTYGPGLPPIKAGDEVYHVFGKTTLDDMMPHTFYGQLPGGYLSHKAYKRIKHMTELSQMARAENLGVPYKPNRIYPVTYHGTPAEELRTIAGILGDDAGVPPRYEYNILGSGIRPFAISSDNAIGLSKYDRLSDLFHEQAHLYTPSYLIRGGNKVFQKTPQNRIDGYSALFQNLVSTDAGFKRLMSGKFPIKNYYYSGPEMYGLLHRAKMYAAIHGADINSWDDLYKFMRNNRELISGGGDDLSKALVSVRDWSALLQIQRRIDYLKDTIKGMDPKSAEYIKLKSELDDLENGLNYMVPLANNTRPYNYGAHNKVVG